MNTTRIAAVVLFSVALAACGKKHKDEPEPTPPSAMPALAPAADPTPPSAAAPVAASAPAPASAPASEPTAEERERAEKQAKLDFATMEDHYINDPHGQWAQEGTASSSFNDDKGRPALIVGSPDGKQWTNNHQDIGFDWLQATFAKPTAATEVRIVCNDNAVLSISKLEVQDAAGNWNTVWSGLSDAKPEKRGGRNWFVKTFPKTAYPVKAVKATFANNVATGYKEVDSVQLVGE